MSTPDPSLVAQANSIANSYGIPPSIFDSMISLESGWDPNAKNPTPGSTASGLGQLTAATAQGLGVTDVFDPTQNLEGAAQLLANAYQTTGNWYDALRSYNQGPTGAANNPSAGASYASSILAAAGLGANSGSASNSATSATPGSASTLANGVADIPQNNGGFPSWMPMWLRGVFTALGVPLTAVAYDVVALFIIIVLVWFGFKAVIED